MTHVFYIDGSLRDIYIKDVSIGDWQTLLDYLQTNNFDVEFYSEGEIVKNLFYDAEKIFNLRYSGEGVPWMTVRLDKVKVNCYFFDDNEIEFDIDPKEITDLYSVNLISEFMIKLANILNKEVILTPESEPEYPMLIAMPGTKKTTVVSY